MMVQWVLLAHFTLPLWNMGMDLVVRTRHQDMKCKLKKSAMWIFNDIDHIDPLLIDLKQSNSNQFKLNR
jgi:hypothetical protein